MKVLYFTDTHIRGNNPANRKDIFVDSIERKIKEIIDLVEVEKIDFLLHGGDMFDRPDVSISVVNRFVKVINKIDIPFYLISGNHDIYGHNPDTINRTVLSLLNTLDIVNIINSNDKIILETNNLKVQLTGQPYVYDIDGLDKEKYYMPESIDPDVDYAIHMVHGMLLDKPFVKGVQHTLLDDIKHTKADITLSGHYHGGFKTAKIDDKYFVNPGSIVRISNSISEMKRKPKVVIIELDKNKIEIKDVFLKTAKPGYEVLDRKRLEEASFKGERILEFKRSIDSAMNFEKMDVNELILEVSSAMSVDDKVKKEALKRIADIQMKGMN